MANDKITLPGTVLEVCRGGQFRCEVDIGNVKKEIMAYASGRIKKYDIKVVVGDKIEVELSPYDFSKGRIVFREK